MSYAVRNDMQGWRAVAGPDDVLPDEWYSTEVPPKPVPPLLTVEGLSVSVKEKRDQLLAAATNRMGPLQDAIDEDVATSDEQASLKLWRQYRIALNRIEHQEGYPSVINWPITPQ